MDVEELSINGYLKLLPYTDNTDQPHSSCSDRNATALLMQERGSTVIVIVNMHLTLPVSEPMLIHAPLCDIFSPNSEL